MKLSFLQLCSTCSSSVGAEAQTGVMVKTAAAASEESWAQTQGVLAAKIYLPCCFVPSVMILRTEEVKGKTAMKEMQGKIS